MYLGHIVIYICTCISKQKPTWASFPSVDGDIHGPSQNTSSETFPWYGHLVRIECSYDVYFIWWSSKLSAIPRNVEKIGSRYNWNVCTSVFATSKGDNLHIDLCSHSSQGHIWGTCIDQREAISTIEWMF